MMLELHSRLASELELFEPEITAQESGAPGGIFPFPNQDIPRDTHTPSANRKLVWVAGLAAGLALVAAIGWTVQSLRPRPQRDAAPPVVVSAASEWKSSATNLPGQDYPRINSDRRAQFRINAPNAKQVSIIIASSDMGSPLTVAKSDDGLWTITTSPLGIGFHFYRVLIDGVSVADPATEIFSGGGGDWRSSGIEVPTGEDFFETKDVPHGEVREQQVFSPTLGAARRIFVYTPPNYQQNASATYPVLYLLPGRGEDETSWPAQGRVGQILDNLIAEQKAKPMLVVMDGGVARKPGEPETPFRGATSDSSQRSSTLEEVFLNDLVPAIDREYRTIPDGRHRALAGLSLGGMQAFAIGFGHPEHFASIGGFSGGGSVQGTTLRPQITPRDPIMDAGVVNRPSGILFLSVGVEEPEGWLSRVKQSHEALKAAGINHVYYESPGTGHEWHTWRRSLREFASLLFQE
ncbi:MAG: alpha/beta hydrolase-fold protein [Opitutaceae bacterium]